MIKFLVFCASVFMAASLTGCRSAPPSPGSAVNSEVRTAQSSGESAAAARAKSDAAPTNAVAAAALDYENNVYFDFGKTVLTARGMETLTAHAKRLKGNAKLVVTLFGHTDNLGSPAYNQAISDARLSAVMKILQAQGVARRQIRRISLGSESRNAVRCRSDDCRQSMRRVELVYSPGARR